MNVRIVDERPLCGLSAVDPGVDPVCTRTRVKNIRSNFCQNQPDPNSCDRLWQFDALDYKVCNHVYADICFFNGSKDLWPRAVSHGAKTLCVHIKYH